MNKEFSMCLNGVNKSPFVDKTTPPPKVDRTNPDVPAPPVEEDKGKEPAFGIDKGDGVKKYEEGADPVNPSLRLSRTVNLSCVQLASVGCYRRH